MSAPDHKLPRVLVLTHRVPYPPDKGDRIRTYHLLRQLATRAKVWLLALADEPVNAEQGAALNELCERIEIVPVGRKHRWLRAAASALSGRSLSEGLFHEPAADRVLSRWSSEVKFTAAVASASSVAPYLLRNGLERVTAVVDLMDVDSQKWLDFAASSRAPKSWLYRFEAIRVRKLERELPGRVAGIGLVSRAEADVYESFAGRGTATVATNGVDLNYFRVADGPTDQSCVFVGALDYWPNVDAAVWFAREVWPKVRRRFPSAAFHIVGRQPVKAVQDLAQLPGVTVVGQVPDVRPYVASAGIAVIPLRLARGVQNKVLEALAMGKATIASSGATAALKTEPGRDLLAANTAPEWVEAIGNLFADLAKRIALGIAGRTYVETHHHWDRCLEPLVNRIVPVAPAGEDLPADSEPTLVASAEPLASV